MNSVKKNIFCFFVISIFSVQMSQGASASADNNVSENSARYQECYLISYYTQQAIIMRYSGLSRFDMMDFFKNILLTDIPSELVSVNKKVLLGADKFIDDAFDSDFFPDQQEAEKYINKKKDSVYSQCMKGSLK